ncbi:MAG: efflux RND transporter periplasmic adaptor subunit [Planctomycetes bacterium]|nr:efflux RND transporter periplasmic adaptor subunit [Planctomycetota bacterium]
MQRQIIISLLLVVVLLAGGAGVAALLVRTAPQPPTNPTERAALLVVGLELKPRTVIEPIVGYGTAHADRQAWIAAQVSGELVELSPKLHVGEPVEDGEQLIRIDDREYQRQLERARSLLAADEAQLERLVVEEDNVDRLIGIATTELEIAQREHERVLGLFEAQQAPRRELDQARQGFEQARRELQMLENQKALYPQQRAVLLANRDLHRADAGLAELDLERCHIRAPFRGRLEAVEVEIGERVNVGTRLFALLDPDLIEVPIELPVSLRDRVASGAKCELKLESNPNVAWSGQVARIAPSAAQATRTFSLFVEVDNTRQEPPLMPGLFVRARIDGPTWRDVLVIPRGIIQQEHVFLYNDGLARRRAVKVDRHLFDQALVSGLKVGEVVITSNLDALYDGAPVRIQPDPPVAGQPAGEASPGASAAEGS